MAMAAGVYVSVSSQANSEAADLERERRALEEKPKAEMRELTQIYVERGLTPALARQVAEQLMAKDALSAHACDELGFAEGSESKPIVAAVASAIAFSIGAATDGFFGGAGPNPRYWGAKTAEAIPVPGAK